MPRHLISDVHEWSDEIPGVPTASSEPTAKGTGLVCRRGKKTLLSLTLVVCGAGRALGGGPLGECAAAGCAMGSLAGAARLREGNAGVLRWP
jgi:hypothetical protein